MPPTADRRIAKESPPLLLEPTSNEVETLLSALQGRQMDHAALLFVAGHRPLAFVLGQCLHALTPFAGMVGWDNCAQWATLMSHQDGPALLEERLHDGIQ